MKNPIEIGGVKVAAGEQMAIDLPLPSLYSHSPVCMPVYVVNGHSEGPVLFVSAAIHGDEINGVEIIRRVLNKQYIKQLKGTLIAIPVVNVHGFVTQSRYLPDRRDLNRSFPGSKKGSMAARLADTFMQEIVCKCDYGIDLHTAAVSRENLPQIRAKVIDAPETEALARAFGTPIILNAEIRDGSLREAVSNHGIPVLLYEAGEALRFNEVSIRAGVKGVINVMRHLDMLPKLRTKKTLKEPIISNSSQWIRAPQSGIFRTVVTLGGRVTKGDIIGWVADPFGEQEQEVVAKFNGIVIGKTHLPLVHEGEALLHIARVTKPNTTAKSVEIFHNEYDPNRD